MDVAGLAVAQDLPATQSHCMGAKLIAQLPPPGVAGLLVAHTRSQAAHKVHGSRCDEAADANARAGRQGRHREDLHIFQARQPRVEQMLQGRITCGRTGGGDELAVGGALVRTVMLMAMTVTPAAAAIVAIVVIVAASVAPASPSCSCCRGLLLLSLRFIRFFCSLCRSFGSGARCCGSSDRSGRVGARHKIITACSSPKAIIVVASCACASGACAASACANGGRAGKLAQKWAAGRCVCTRPNCSPQRPHYKPSVRVRQQRRRPSASKHSRKQSSVWRLLAHL